MDTASAPIEVEEIPVTEITRLVEKGFKGYKKLVKTRPGGIIMGARFAENANKIRNFEFRPDDIVVMTYPKSGTTWLLETVWAMRNLHQLHLAEKDPITERSFFIEADGLYSLERQMNMKSTMEKFGTECPGKRPEDGIVLHLAAASKTPRILKTHLPINFYPSSILDVCKVIYVCRDPRDICVSYHHHCRLISTYQFEGSFEDFADTFMDADLYYGSYWDHISPAWQLRHHRNLHFMFYEDLKRDVPSQMKLLNDFLDCHLREDQLKQVGDHASFDSMKARDKLAPMTFSSITSASEDSFFRKGITGDWKNVASASLDNRMQQWMQQNAKATEMQFDKYT